jgi:hypothetical protein
MCTGLWKSHSLNQFVGICSIAWTRCSGYHAEFVLPHFGTLRLRDDRLRYFECRELSLAWQHIITTPGQDRYIRVFHLRNRTVAASTTAAEIPWLRRISSQTVRNLLQQHGIRPRRLYFHSLEMVLWLTFRGWAISFWDSPALRRPIAIFRVAGSNLGMVAYQHSNKSQTSNLVVLYALVSQLK